MASLTVTSPAYSEGKPIPAEFTCDGDGRSPPLSIAGLPPGVRFLSLVFDDPDAPRGTWTHWTFWDLPTGGKGPVDLPAGVDVEERGARQGRTSAGTVGYHGPCPPGGTHRYVVHAFASSEPLGLPNGASIEVVHAELKRKAFAMGTLTGTYKRS
jgi:Raf kinase inhibitor-like YbhB/YbcL family protein